MEIQLQLSLTDSKGKNLLFRLGAPVSISREVLIAPFSSKTKSTNAFHLPQLHTRILEIAGQFSNDTNQVGPYNLDILSYVPHGLTHLETSAHLLAPNSNPPTIKDIPLGNLCGIVYLIDLTHLGAKPGQQIPPEAVENKLKQNKLSISMLALKTKASLLSYDYDFSGKDFLSLAPETAKIIHDYRGPSPDPVTQQIHCLILDLPSIDPEKDKKLLAHRQYFGIPLTGYEGEDREKRALVELAWFPGLKEGYYYTSITPPRFQDNAVSTGIVFYPLIQQDAGSKIP